MAREGAFTLFNQPSPSQIRQRIGKANLAEDVGLAQLPRGRGMVALASQVGRGIGNLFTDGGSPEEDKARKTAIGMEQFNASGADFQNDPLGALDTYGNIMMKQGRSDLAFQAFVQKENIEQSRKTLGIKLAKARKGKKPAGQDINERENQIVNDLRSGNFGGAHRQMSKLRKVTEMDPGEGFKSATNTKISNLTAANVAITEAQNALTMSSVGFAGNVKSFVRGSVGQMDSFGLTSLANILRGQVSDDASVDARAKQDFAVVAVAKALTSSRGGGGGLTKKSIEEAKNMLRVRDQLVDPEEVNRRLTLIIEGNAASIERLEGDLDSGKISDDLIIKSGGRKIPSGPKAGWWIPVERNGQLMWKKLRGLN